MPSGFFYAIINANIIGAVYKWLHISNLWRPKEKGTLIVSEKLKVFIRNVVCVMLLILSSTIAVIVSVVIVTDKLQSKVYTISIYDGESLTEVRSTDLSVENALERANVKLSENDKINVGIKDELTPDNTNIYIDRARKVSIKIGDKEPTEIFTLKNTVEEVLYDYGINTNENETEALNVTAYDYINVIPETLLNDDITNIEFKKAIAVPISIDGITQIVYTTKNTIGEVLEDNDISVSDEDLINQKLTGTIDLSNTEIVIKTSHQVTLKYDGNEKKNIKTQAKNAGELLKEYNIKLSGLDRLASGVTVNTKIKDNLVISVIRVVEKKITETVTIPYQTKIEYTADMFKGLRQYSGKKGSNGVKTNTYTIVTENGKQVSKTLTSSAITKQPVNDITLVGTKTFTTFSSKFKLKHDIKKTVDVKAVAYNLEGLRNRKPTDPAYGKTANGMKVRAGIIAVDKNVIPVGTKVYVEVPGGSDYGYAIAADVGVRGYTIDLYLNSVTECRNWGRRSVKVHILKDQKVDVFKLRADAEK